MSEPTPKCARCDDSGYVCENCHEPEVRCDCEDAQDDDLIDYDELPDLRRCKCNPYVPKVAT